MDSSATGAFVEAWRALDRTGRGFLTPTDLFMYMRANGYEDSFVKKYLKMFDPNDNKIIYVERFCETLGIDVSEITSAARVGAPSAGFSPKPAIVYSDSDSDNMYAYLWRSVDKARRGFITPEDLMVHMKAEGLDTKNLKKMMTLLDPDNTHIIKLEHYCSILGVDVSEITGETRVRLPANVNFISGDMSLEWQIKIVSTVQDTLRDTQKMSEAPKRIKTTLDRLYGQLWHVVIAQGQFWCHYGHEPAFSFVFQIGKQVFIIFKTPCL